MKRNVAVSLVLWVGAILLGVGPLMALPGDSYDLKKDIQFATNPNGVWSCGYTTDAVPASTANFQLLTYVMNPWQEAGLIGWTVDSLNTVPAVFQNNKSTAYYDIPMGYIGIQPGVGMEKAIVRWTAPDNGLVLIAGKFSKGDVGTSDYIINYKITTSLLFEYDATDDLAFNLARVVTAGDTIDFAVGVGEAVSGDTVGVDVVITYLYPSEQQETWNFAQNYSFTDNPHKHGSAVWTLGYEPSTSPRGQTVDFTPLTRFRDPFMDGFMYEGLVAWTVADYILPQSSYNKYNVPNPDDPNDPNEVKFGIHPGEASIHGGLGHEESVARWTSLGAGVINITGEFRQGDFGAVDYYIIHNKTKQLFAEPNTLLDYPFDLQVTVAPGDTIDFAAGVGETCSGDTVVLDATITTEPGLWAVACDSLDARFGADFNQDCHVDLNDFAFFAAEWLVNVDLGGPSGNSGVLGNWDAATNFSTASNPIAPWSYGYKPSAPHRTGTTEGFTLFPYFHSGFPGSTPVFIKTWTTSSTNTDSIPGLFKNTSTTIPFNGIGARKLGATPGPGFEEAILRWTAPSAGTANISGSFGTGSDPAAGYGGGSSDYFITVNQTQVIFEALNEFRSLPISQKVYVNAGDTIDFVAGPGIALSSDFVEFNVAIQLVDYKPGCSDIIAGYSVPHQPVSDWSDNCSVGVEDLILVLADWLKCNDPQGGPLCDDIIP